MQTYFPNPYNMKIAIPTRDNHVDDHFGHCDHYTIYTIANKEITATETLPSPEGCGCKSGIASDLQALGVEVMLAGNMGEGAKNKLEAHGIKVIRGCQGEVDSLVKSYLAGFIFDSGKNCSAHGEGHQCHHHEHHDQ